MERRSDQDRRVFVATIELVQASARVACEELALAKALIPLRVSRREDRLASIEAALVRAERATIAAAIVLANLQHIKPGE
jgi:hypothetical protein